jgi:Phytanoyl-CoA dioxygenase (PhyH)
MPEICTAKQADFSKVWQQNGTAKVAAFLSPQELGELRTAVNGSYDLLRQHADDDPPTLTEYLTDHYKRWDGIWVKELRGYLEQANPELRAQFDSVIAAAERRFRSLFDQNWRLEPNFTFVRRHRSTQKYLPWHIDADAAGIINSTDYCINTWLPLDPVGDVLPSLELIPGSNKTMRTVPSLEGNEKSRPDDWVKSNIAGESWIPHAEPGDAILFDHWTLHRTQRMLQDDVMRTSCEFRFVRTS